MRQERLRKALRGVIGIGSRRRSPDRLVAFVFWSTDRYSMHSSGSDMVAENGRIKKINITKKIPVTVQACKLMMLIRFRRMDLKSPSLGDKRGEDICEEWNVVFES